MKVEKTVRIITLAPLMALYALGALWFAQPALFGNLGNFLASLGFLTLLPLLAYPLQPFIPGFRDKGRDGQRKLAIVMAVVGYVAGTIFALAMSVPKHLLFIFAIYLISGLLIALFNKVLHIKASGHACGVAGPVAYLVYFLGWPALAASVLLVGVFWASLRMKRHTWSQLLWGTAIPIAALAIAHLLGLS